ncbi:HAD-IA family hydrolase [Azospirillum halopraeferens]|uniref:HAD-IA family hydrolase n=1 Tax=Azospirillum halopraeferens TaxID=34010 RepID=UPI0003F4BC6D|nr:HAD-IA family hydrolase [Azospirillum halopraeferens]
MVEPLRALIFDVDGTLAETEEVHRLAFNRAFEEAGIPWSWDRTLYRALLAVSGGKERIRAYAADHDPGRTGIDALVRDVHARKTEIYTGMVREGGVPFRPGVARLIEEARAAGLILAVATTTTRANVDALLDANTGGTGHGWFATFACADDAPPKKPDPMVYRVVLERIGLPASACIALEDSPNGVAAATGAGIAVVVSTSVYTDGDDFTGAAAVFPDFGSVTLDDLRSIHTKA